MDQSVLDQFGSPEERVKMAAISLRNENGVVIVHPQAGEARGHLVFGTETLTLEHIQLMMRECSGMMFLCLTPERAAQLQLPLTEITNETGVDYSMDAARGISNGICAPDRLATIQAAAAPNAAPEDLRSPGHIFPCLGNPIPSDTVPHISDAVISLAQLAQLSPMGVRSEILPGPGGVSTSLDGAATFGMKHHLPVITTADIALCLAAQTA